MRCRNALLRLDQLRTGELDAVESSRVEDHCQTCRTCGESLDEISQFAGTVQSALRHEYHAHGAVTDRFDEVVTKAGNAWVVFSDRGVRLIIREIESEEALRRRYMASTGRLLARAPLPEEDRAQIANALTGGETDAKANCDLSGLPPFEREVLEALASIPRGEVRPYAWVARQVGRPRAVRAVGNAVAKNPLAPVIPCHRVVPTAGGVGNYALGTAMKRDLLQREGVEVEELERYAKERVRYVGTDDQRVFCFPTCVVARNASGQERVTFRDEQEAFKRGYSPCTLCLPVSLSA